MYQQASPVCYHSVNDFLTSGLITPARVQPLHVPSSQWLAVSGT